MFVFQTRRGTGRDIRKSILAVNGLQDKQTRSDLLFDPIDDIVNRRNAPRNENALLAGRIEKGQPPLRRCPATLVGVFTWNLEIECAQQPTVGLRLPIVKMFQDVLDCSVRAFGT